MLNVYFGHDERAEAGTTAFVRSVIANARAPISLTPITRLGVGDQPEGSNAFTFRRFLVPYLQDWCGWAVFVDGSDMISRADINEILALADCRMAVHVVKHDYRTQHARKYRGTAMEADNVDYPRKQWASVMLINCGHYAWRKVIPEYVATADAMHLLQLQFIPNDRIGSLPAEWNWLADEHGENLDAKLVHFTAGIPAFPAHHDAPMAEEWRSQLLSAISTTG